jgi:hypothetical protein
MIVTVSARCERRPARLPPRPSHAYPARLSRLRPGPVPGRRTLGPARRGAPVHLAPAAHTSAPGRPDTPAPPPVQPAVVCCTRGGSRWSPGPAPEPGVCLTAAYSTVDNFAGNVDGEAAESFFHAQAVDGISAGSRGSRRQSLSIVPTCILSLRTTQSACLHRISTGLCTPRLDASGVSAQDCRSHLLQLSWRRVRATSDESVGRARGVR